MKILNRFQMYPAVFENMLNIPFYIQYVGGGLSKIDFLYSEGIKAVQREVFSDYILTPILKNKLGDSAGVYGAALLREIQ